MGKDCFISLAVPACTNQEIAWLHVTGRRRTDTQAHAHTCGNRNKHIKEVDATERMKGR